MVKATHRFSADSDAIAVVMTAFPDAVLDRHLTVVVPNYGGSGDSQFQDIAWKHVTITGPTRRQVAQVLVAAGLPSRDAKRFGIG